MVNKRTGGMAGDRETAACPLPAPSPVPAIGHDKAIRIGFGSEDRSAGVSLGGTAGQDVPNRNQRGRGASHDGKMTSRLFPFMPLTKKLEKYYNGGNPQRKGLWTK